MIIDDDVPLPKPHKIYTFEKLKNGQSVFFPNEPRGSQSNPATAARSWCQRHGGKSISRAENGGVRIWIVT